mmetsp:Transcript_54826/g.151776  ORF Transcript_54826/g.151776 Transcript_54826/m.151776 type:complete len:277 (-) Transcript_54826:605-1435(-)
MLGGPGAHCSAEGCAHCPCWRVGAHCSCAAGAQCSWPGAHCSRAHCSWPPGAHCSWPPHCSHCEPHCAAAPHCSDRGRFAGCGPRATERTKPWKSVVMSRVPSLGRNSRRARHCTDPERPSKAAAVAAGMPQDSMKLEISACVGPGSSSWKPRFACSTAWPAQGSVENSESPCFSAAKARARMERTKPLKTWFTSGVSGFGPKSLMTWCCNSGFSCMNATCELSLRLQACTKPRKAAASTASSALLRSATDLARAWKAWLTLCASPLGAKSFMAWI